MAETIRGITISIGADTKSFESGIKKVDKSVNQTNKQVDALQKSLTIEYDASRFTQAQKLAQDALITTEQKAEALRKELNYLESTGVDTQSEKYQKFQTELIKTESQAVKLRDKLEQINRIPLDNLIKQINQLGSAFTTAGQMMMPFSVASSGILAGLGKLTSEVISTGASFDDTAQRINLSAEELQKWQYIAMQTGLDNSQLETSLTKVQAGLADLASGTTSTASTALQELGFTAEQASLGMSANFEKIIEALQNIEDPVLQALYVNEIFGDRLGSKLLPLLNAGGEGLEQLTAEFESLGYMTNEQVSSLADFDDMLNRIKYSLAQAGNQVALALLPVLEQLANLVQERIIPYIQRLADWFSSLSESQQKLILVITAITAVLGPALLVLGKLTTGIGGLMKTLVGLKGTLDIFTTHPIIATITTIITIIGVLLALMTQLYNSNEEFKASVDSLLNSLMSSLQPVLLAIANLVQTLMSALSPLLDLLVNMLGQAIIPMISALQPLIQLLGTILTDFLVPIINTVAQLFTTLMNYINPILQSVIPAIISAVNAVMSVLQPLFQFINDVLGPVFQKLGDIITSVFSAIPNIINTVLKFIERLVNNVIDFINTLTSGINSAFGWLGVNIGKLEHVSLQIPTYQGNNSTSNKWTDGGGFNPDTNTNIGNTGNYNPDDYKDVINQTPGTVGGDVINNDYSNKDITINVTVENYAEEVDVDDLINQINIKLAEQM